MASRALRRGSYAGGVLVCLLFGAGTVAAGVKILRLVLLFTGFALCSWGFLTEEPRRWSGTFERSTSSADWTSR
jgi:hypothetical protein